MKCIIGPYRNVRAFFISKKNEGTHIWIQKSFTELSRILGKNEIQPAPPERNTLPILHGAHPACRVGPSGELCEFPGDLDSPEASDLYFKAAPIGQRFAAFYEDIKALVPNAAVIDLNFDVSVEAAAPGENLVNGLKDATITLGKIFNKNEDAKKLSADFDQAIADAKSAYNGTDTIMSILVSGGEIGFSAPLAGRVWGPMYEAFGWVSALEVEGASSDHQGDDVSVEAIAQSNPDWIFVLDRDAAVSSTTSAVPAQDVIDNSPALQNTTAVSKGQIVYAPNDTYTNESIQTYLELFQELANALAG